MPYALLVEDDPASLDALTELVQTQGFETGTAMSLEEANAKLRGRVPDVTIMDLYLPDGNGLEFLRSVRANSPGKLVVVTGQASVETAIDAFRIGADDYLTKPVEPSRLRAVLESVARERAARTVGTAAETNEEVGNELLGASPAMDEVRRLIARVAPTNASVLISGETGTGKEMVANLIHRLSRRTDGPFVAVNCAALSPNLLESELFGHEKGSFTGANRRHLGLFERANVGTLFLDEITEMPVDLQTKLLRVLESGTFIRVGGDADITTKARVIAATNLDPEEALKEGRLRQDLLYRLNVFPIVLPPLRQRGTDVLLLTDQFLAQLNQEEGENKRLTPECREALSAYRWPGNVRELKNLVRRAFILADQEIDGTCFFTAPEKAPVADDATGQLRLPLGQPLAEIERRVIMSTLELCGGHRRRTAEMLQISPKTLYNRLAEYRAGAPETA